MKTARLYNVLVVEDDPEAVEIVERILSQYNFRVFAAGDVLQARRRLEQGPLDLVILDIMLPVRDGFQMLSEGIPPSIPVLMMTANSTGQNVMRAAEYGVSGFLAKPVQESVLIEKISKTLRFAEGDLVRRRDCPLKVVFKSLSSTKLQIGVSGIPDNGSEILAAISSVRERYPDLTDLDLVVDASFKLNPDAMDDLERLVARLVTTLHVASQRISLDGGYFSSDIRAQVATRERLSGCKMLATF